MSQQIIREAIVIDVDVQRQTCKLDYGDARLSEISSEVPLPNFIGAGNNGLINIIKPNTRVLVAFIGVYSRQTVAIIAVLPSYSQQNSVSPSLGLSSDVAPGTTKYPSIKEGEVVLSSHSGPSLHLKEDREMSLSDQYGKGFFFNYDKESHSIESSTNNFISHTSGGRLFFGEVRRNEQFIILPDEEDLINYNQKILGLTRPVGFISTLLSDNAPAGKNLRNPSLAEYRLVVNEFTTDSQFSSFEDELRRRKKTLKPRSRSEKLKRYNDPTNLLGLSQKELIEVVSGNLIDTNGMPLDINYNYIKLFKELNTNNGKDDTDFISAAKKSRRGIGHHFQLNTASFAGDKNINLRNFVFDIDKEGVFKLHVPKTTSTGNILYPTTVNFSCGEDKTIIGTAPSNPSKKIPVPVMLRDEKGNPLPTLRPESYYRYTGIRFFNDDYFKSTDDSNYVRVNKTKHHNIYEAAERLIANTVRAINIPTNFVQVKPDGSPKIIKDPNFLGYNYSSRSFERLERDDKDLKFDYGFSTLSVSPGNPPINTGGDTVFAGKNMSLLNTDDKEQSNKFSSTITGDTVSFSGEAGHVSSAGVSANMDFEGGVEVSVGSDEADGKSLTLDTAGSLIAWFGKDKNGRSMVVQTDGEVLFNIGGSYDYSNPNNPTLNKGRLDIRVNVNNRGFYDENITNQPELTEGTGSSDYIISISENGLVIAGGTRKPLLLRNKGEIMIESESIVSLYGKEINFITPGREPTPFTKMSKDRQR